MNRKHGNRGGKRKSTTKLPQRLVDELSEKAKPILVEVVQPRGNSKKRKLPVEEAEPVIPDNRKFSKRFVNKTASRKEQRKAERKNKKQKKPTPTQKPALKPKAIPGTDNKPQKQIPKEINKLQNKKISTTKELPKITKTDVEEEEEDRYLRQLEKKLKIKDASKVLNSSLFKEDGLDELLSGITVGSNKLLGKKVPKEESSELDESESDSEEELIAGAHYYSTRKQHEDEDLEELSEEDSGSSEASGSEIESEGKKAAVADENAVVSKYVPPHLRKTDDKLVKLRRLLQGLINKLNETNIESILADIDQMYLDYSRNNVTTTITDLILLSVSERSNLLDSFVIINATIIAGVYRLVGTEAAAHFTQTLVEKLMKHHAKANEGEEDTKMCLNLITLVAELYNLGVVSCVLIYSIIRFFLQDMVPHNVELLLKMIRAIGPALRQDDPSAMKDIILLAQKNAPTGAKLGVRFKFMMEVMNDLKNNKVKKSSHLATQNALAEDTVRRMKTLLKNIEKRRQTTNSEPLQVSLDDIMSASTKGKWWLVGAAWKGEEVPVQKVDSVETNDPNSLLTLARQQRMSTDLRKQIFTVLMSSEDFTDAYERLMKLGLSEKQQRDIPRVLLHCCGNEKTYNPFYSLVAARLNAYRASFKITFQYALWDFLRELGESGVGGLGGTHSSTTSIAQVPVRRLINLAKFFGYLLGKVSLPLTILKSLTFTSLKSRSRLFLQLAIIHQFINTDDESIASQVAKLTDLKDLRQGLAFFIHHFVATPTDLAASSLSVQEKETVASRAKFTEDLLKL